MMAGKADKKKQERFIQLVGFGNTIVEAAQAVAVHAGR